MSEVVLRQEGKFFAEKESVVCIVLGSSKQSTLWQERTADIEEAKKKEKMREGNFTEQRNRETQEGDTEHK